MIWVLGMVVAAQLKMYRKIAILVILPQKALLASPPELGDFLSSKVYWLRKSIRCLVHWLKAV